MNFYWLIIRILILLKIGVMHARKKDYFENVKEYFDINLMLSAHLLLPSVDSKDFMDRPMKNSLNIIKREFRKIEEDLGLISLEGLSSRRMNEIIAYNINTLTVGSRVKGKKRKKLERIKREKRLCILKSFIDKHFCEVGYDLEEAVPEDFQEKLCLIEKLTNQQLKEITNEINEKWKKLYRRRKQCTPTSVSTLIDIPHPFYVPGGRFREYYYWDTYWILEGLLACNMELSASNVIENFIFLIKNFGFIPNGIRKYYAHRTQPPYFPLMLLTLYNYNKEKFKDLVLNEGLDMAIEEYNFFIKYRSMELDGMNEAYSLCLYKVDSDYPRPESFNEDVSLYKSDRLRSHYMIYSNIKSATESGLDFSTKWETDGHELYSISTYEQIPAELNAIMFRNENIISELLKEKGNLEESNIFKERALKRERAINEILWNETEETWMDYNLATKDFVNWRFYFSNVEPLLWGVTAPVNKYKILLKYHKELFSYPGGIPASGYQDIPTEQQWDFPNAWAPHQHTFISYLLKINEREMALHCARSFFRAALGGYNECKEFFEKYNVTCPGKTGFGGEYAPQCGFGWTNGALLKLIEWFGDDLISETDHCQSYYSILEYLMQKIEEN